MDFRTVAIADGLGCTVGEILSLYEDAEFSVDSMKGVRIDRREGGNVSESVLELAVPSGAGNAAQVEAIGDAAEYASELGIKLKIVEVE